MMRRTIALAVVAAAAGCASTPPPPLAPTISFEQKMASILRLEDRRMLRDPAPPPLPPAPAVSGRRVPAVPPPPPPPDLVRMLTDAEARVRRRSALAVGHVGLREGVAPLATLLRDSDPEVRQMAAFALGLIGHRDAVAPLLAALADESPLVKGSAAEALGLIGDASAADGIGQLAAQLVDSGAVAQIPGEDADTRRDLPSSALRLAVYALVRLKAYDQLAAAVLDSSGQPKVRWWPVAYALQRIEDRRAAPALLALVNDPHPYTRAFAAKGLGGLKERSAVQPLLALVGDSDTAVTIESVRALGRIGDPAAAGALVKLLQTAGTNVHVRLEVLDALGSMRAPGVADLLLDSLTDPNPAIRAAALRSSATLDPQQFIAVLSGLDPDPAWNVRAAIAAAFGTMPSDVAIPGLTAMLKDKDSRVLPAVIEALVKLRPPNITETLLAQLKASDVAVRIAAASGLGELKPPNVEQALADAYQAGLPDSTYSARTAALAALSKYGAAAATPVLRTALADKDWAVRRRAAMLLKEIDPSAGDSVDEEIRPASTLLAPEAYEAARLIAPPVSTRVYLDTDRGTIEIELAVLDAPLTVENFERLARMGFFDGQPIHRVVPDFVIQGGDPRGDGEGGPGYTIRDELNQRPYLRGTVGMALDLWGDSGGSQFFITHSPQPHLDAKYTVFGRVVDGMNVVDQIQQGDIVRRVRVWDGETTR